MNPLAQAPQEPPPMPEPPVQPPVQPPEAGAVAQQPLPPVAPLNKAQARQDLIYNGAIFGAALIGLAIVFSAVRYWTRRQTQDCDSPAMSLSSFREMYENGELSEEEYEQIRTKMAAKMKGQLGIRPKAPAKPQPDHDVGRNGTPPAPESEG